MVITAGGRGGGIRLKNVGKKKKKRGFKERKIYLF